MVASSLKGAVPRAKGSILQKSSLLLCLLSENLPGASICQSLAELPRDAFWLLSGLYRTLKKSPWFGSGLPLPACSANPTGASFNLGRDGNQSRGCELLKQEPLAHRCVWQRERKKELFSTSTDLFLDPYILSQGCFRLNPES